MKRLAPILRLFAAARGPLLLGLALALAAVAAGAALLGLAGWFIAASAAAGVSISSVNKQSGSPAKAVVKSVPSTSGPPTAVVPSAS